MLFFLVYINDTTWTGRIGGQLYLATICICETDKAILKYTGYIYRMDEYKSDLIYGQTMLLKSTINYANERGIWRTIPIRTPTNDDTIMVSASANSNNTSRPQNNVCKTHR